MKRLSDAEVYAAYLGVDSRWRGESGVGAPKLSHADELQKMLRGQPYNARGVRQALQEARELLFEESSLRYDDFRHREGEIQRARVGGAILSGLTLGLFDLESLAIYDPAVLQLARQESSAALDALITGIEWAPVAVSLGVGAARTLAPRMFGRQGAWATSLVATRRATGVVRRATSARRGALRGVAAYRGPQVAAPGSATLGSEIDEALAVVRRPRRSEQALSRGYSFLRPGLAIAGDRGLGFLGKGWRAPSGSPSRELRAQMLRVSRSRRFRHRVEAMVAAEGRTFDWLDYTRRMRVSDFREYGSLREGLSVGFAGKTPESRLGWTFAFNRTLRRMPIVGDSAVAHELIHSVQDVMSPGLMLRERVGTVPLPLLLKLEWQANRYGSPLASSLAALGLLGGVVGAGLLLADLVEDAMLE